MSRVRIDILTLFPGMFPEVLDASILGRAVDAGIVGVHLHDIRDYTEDRHNRVDDRPFGGGPGMVMMCQPLFDCVTAVEAMDDRKATRILMTPQGEQLTQQRVESFASCERLLIIAGHYEGIDERVINALAPIEISVGDFVVSGGELPAMMLVDAVTRLLPGALGHAESAKQDSFSIEADENTDAGPNNSDDDGSDPDGNVDAGIGHHRRMLDHPHYTRPRVWRGMAAPDVLLSGDHGAIQRWRAAQRVDRTRQRRPDLLQSTQNITRRDVEAPRHVNTQRLATGRPPGATKVMS